MPKLGKQKAPRLSQRCILQLGYRSARMQAVVGEGVEKVGGDHVCRGVGHCQMKDFILFLFESQLFIALQCERICLTR